MKIPVTIIDYGIGNLLSVRQAFEYCGADVVTTDSADVIRKAQGLILPGVGAFENGMNGLRERQLIQPIRDFVSTGRALLGICLGMQMLLDSSEEFGDHAGLGFIPGKVTAIPKTKINGEPHKVPHIGWNALLPTEKGGAWDGTLLDGVEPRSCMYFVHSYTAHPAHPEHRLADCDYNGRLISAVVRNGNIYGCQFHPEKSGETGLQIIKNFIRLCR